MTDGLSRRDLIRAGGAGAAGLSVLGTMGCSGDSRARAPAGAPNVVVVVIDSLRADHVYGRRARTRAMAALARESLRFTEVRPEAMPTIPARRSIMEGRQIFPFRDWEPSPGLTAQPGWEVVGHEAPMWTDVLRDAGWTTGYVTDNPHIVSRAHDDFVKKFDRAIRVHGQVPLRRKPTREVSQSELYRHLPPSIRGTRAEPRMRAYLAANPRDRRESEFLAAKVFRRGMGWLEWARRRQPFALVIDTFDAHEPWDAPAALKDVYGPRRARGVEPIQPFPTPAGQPRKLGLSRALVRRMGQLYAAEVTLADRWLGRFLARLENLGVADNTAVVLVSDHGVLLGEHGWVGKRYKELYEELTHVPMMIRDPRRRAAGRSSRYFASTHDIGPTLLSLAGVETADGMNGTDLSPLFDGRQPPRRRYYISSYTDHVIAGNRRWHLIADNQGVRKRLYDKRADPAERRNVASRHPGVRDKLWRAVRRQAGGDLPKFDV